MDNQDHITLKFGTLKEWHLQSERGQELLKQYAEIGMSASTMCQNDTPEQKALICQMIDECSADTICLDWDGKSVSKEEAKAYVMGYQR